MKNDFGFNGQMVQEAFKNGNTVFLEWIKIIKKENLNDCDQSRPIEAEEKHDLDLRKQLYKAQIMELNKMLIILRRS